MWLDSGKVGQLVFTSFYGSGRRALRQEEGVTYYRISKPVSSILFLLEIPQVSRGPQTPKAGLLTGHPVQTHEPIESVSHSNIAMTFKITVRLLNDGIQLCFTVRFYLSGLVKFLLLQ